MDEELFERWKDSKRRNRSGGMKRFGLVLLVVPLLLLAGVVFAGVTALMPAKLIETVEGHVIHEDDDEEFDIRLDDEEAYTRHLKVRLPDGDTTWIDIPKDQALREGAPIKLDLYGKAIGPITIKFHKFAGYADAAP